MIYLMMTFFLSFLSLFEIILKEKILKLILFYIAAATVVIFCSVRYAVGYDFYAYQKIYDQIPNSIFINDGLKDIKGEYLFLKLFTLFKSLGFSYEIASSIILFLINIIFVFTIKKNAKYKILSLLILYSLYFVYIFSTLRQGLAIALSLLICFKFLDSKKIIYYYIFSFLIIFIHSSAIILFIFPLINKYYKFFKNREVMILIIVICCTFLIASYIPSILLILNVEYSSKDFQINYGAIIIRSILFIVIFLSFPKNCNNHFMEMSKKMYVVGFMLYILLCPMDIIASRLSVYMKIFDIFLISYCLYYSKRKIEVYFFTVCYSVTLIINIISGISSYSNLEFYNYPYVTIFNKEDSNTVYSPEN